MVDDPVQFQKGKKTQLRKAPEYKGYPTSTNSTITNSNAIEIEFLLVEFVTNRNVLAEFSLCTTQLVQISHSMIFSRSQKLY